MADVPALGAQHPEEVNFLQNWLGEGNDEQDWNGNGEEGLNIVGEPEYIVPEQVVHGEVQGPLIRYCSRFAFYHLL